MNVNHQVATDPVLLRVDALSLSIHGTQILNGVSFALRPAQVLGIIGESGSGKSMTALSIMQLLPRGSRLEGSIEFTGHELGLLDEKSLCAIRGCDISMVFQEPMTALNPLHTIGRQVAECIQLHSRQSRAKAMRSARNVLDRVGLPGDEFSLNRFPHELSGGQRQRVVIAMAVALKPRLLIADEPTTALDVTTQSEILELLRQLMRSDGMALILISHDLAVVSSIADEVLIMRNGCIVEQGPIRRLFNTRKHAYTRALFDASDHVPARDLSTPRQAELLCVSRLTCEYQKPRHSFFSKAAVFRAVDNVSFSINVGESIGLVGESGCGKSTLARALLGLTPARAGMIRLRGLHVNIRSDLSISARQQMQVVFQDPYGSFNPRHRVGRLIAEPLHVLDNPPRGAAKHRLVLESLEAVGLHESDAVKYIHEFSGGQRQRVALARALIIKPALIILDEAVSALDVLIRAQVLDLLAELADTHQLAYLFISHDLSVVRNITDRVLVMQRGKIVEQGTTNDVFDRPQHDYTKQLIAAIPKLQLASM